MSILTNFRTAAENYAKDNITTSVTPPEPDDEGVISQNEEFSFDLVATNAGDPDGIAVTNVSYHLKPRERAFSSSFRRRQWRSPGPAASRPAANSRPARSSPPCSSSGSPKTPKRWVSATAMRSAA